jgi:hypothetical protein
MFTSIFSFLSSIASVVKTIVLGKNTPAMVAEKTAENKQVETDKIDTAVNTGDADALRDETQT